MRRLLLWTSLVLTPVSATNAQGRPSVPASAIFAGMVIAEIERELLAGATVTLVEANRVATTDQQGAFRFDGLASGDIHLVVQKMGYRPLRTVVHMDSTRRLDAELELERLLPSELAPVVVEATPDRQTIDILRRRASGQGTFFLRDVLDSLQGVSVGELLREKGRGAKMIRYTRTGALLLASGRGFGTISLLPLADPHDSRSPRACYAQVVVDGIRIYAPDAVNQFAPPDLDQFDSARLDAVEFYAGPASTPAEFAGVGAQCGTLVLWTRRSP
ncbi:MAG: carboxypeptidase regulatory-like domain-containing protein [bacterium]